jgi:hypothetical protein
MRFTLALAVLAYSMLSFAQGVDNVQTVASDVFQVKYATNLNIGDSFVDITNSGATTSGSMVGANDPVGTSQNLCANIYTFDPAEEMISCCSCVVTPNGLQSLSVLKSLISNPLTPAVPTSVVIKILATADATCSASFGASAGHGLLAWGTTLHQNTSGIAVPPAATYSMTETAFSPATLSGPELEHLYSTCGFIQSNGSGFGICKGCAAGGLGAGTSIQ